MLSTLLLALATPLPLSPQAPVDPVSATSPTRPPEDRAARLGFASDQSIAAPTSGSFLGTPCLPGPVWNEANFLPSSYHSLFSPGTYCWDNRLANLSGSPQGQSSSWCNFNNGDGIGKDIWARYGPPASSEAYVLDIDIDITISGTPPRLAIWEVPISLAQLGLLNQINYPDPANGVVQLACVEGFVGSLKTRVLVENSATHILLLQLGTSPGLAGAAGTITCAELPAQSLEGCVYDDGTSEESMGATTGGDTVWFQAFDDSCGFDYIDGVDIAVGALGASDVAVGTAITVCVWDDPDDDYLPDDLVLLGTGTGTIATPHTDTLENFSFDSGAIDVDGVYFVGAYVTHGAGVFPAAGDEQVRQLRRHLYWSGVQAVGPFGFPYSRAPVSTSSNDGVQLVGGPSGGQVALGVAVDPIRNRLWTQNASRMTPNSSDLDGLNQAPYGASFQSGAKTVTLDYVREKVYLLSSSESAVYDLDGQPLAQPSPTGGDYSEVDALTGDVYVGNAATILRFDSNGLPIGTAISTTNNVRSIAVDSLAGRLYWVDSTGVLTASALDGSGPSPIAPLEASAEITAVAVNPFGFLYWREVGGVSGKEPIVFANLDGSAPAVHITNAPFIPPSSGAAMTLDHDLGGERSYVAWFASGTFDPATPFTPLSVSELGSPLSFLIRPHEGVGPFPEFCFGDGGNQMACTDCPCMNNAAIGSRGGCLNSSGVGLRLTPSGSTSVSLPAGDTTDLRFGAEGVPPGAFCILNSGDAIAPGNMTNPCFGLNTGAQALPFDGLRCAISNTRRHGGRSADVNGDIGVTNNPWGGEGGPPVGIASAGAGFGAGQTRFFQVINRDDPLLGCMRGLNTSQAVQVTFAP